MQVYIKISSFKVIKLSFHFLNHHFRFFSFLLIFLLSLNFSGFSQYFDVGQDPGKTKWKQINTEHYIIIFPADFTSEALKLAKILDYSYIHVSTSLGHHPVKTPIIIHNKTTISNAYAVWAPRRMEYYTCTPQSTYGQNWLEQLGLHEFRHIVQMDNIDQKTGRLFYYLFGEQSTALLFGLYIPSWFMEGDAVVSETAFSYSGRGRIPEFEMYYRALLLQKGLFHLEKAMLGSFKDYVPSDYYFGYQMVAATRITYGSDIWGKAEQYVARNPFNVFGIQHTIKKITGLTTRQLYYKNFRMLDSLWKKQEASIKYSDYRVISPKNKLYCNYTTPSYLNDSTVLALKAGFDYEKQFVLVRNGCKDQKILTPGYFNPVRLASNGESVIFSYGENKKYEELISNFNGRYITWSEVQYDKRWAQRTWHVIKIYDIQTGKTKTLTRHSRYFGPVMSPDNSMIAAVEVTTDDRFSIVFLDSKSGKLLKRFSTSGNDFFITPSWSENGKYLYTVFMCQNGKKGIMEINTSNLEYRKILEESRAEIYRPVKKGNYIFFNSGYSGIDNIYAINLGSFKIFQVTSARFGAYNANISDGNKKIVYSNYTANGYELAEMAYDSSKWVPLDQISNSSANLYEPLVRQENNILVFDSLPQKNYEVKKYGKAVHLFNFHSWVPFSFDMNSYTISPGLMLLSQNRLSTAFTTLNYGYNLQDKTNSISALFVYKGWYPVLGISAKYGDRKSYFRDYLHQNELSYNWNEAVLGLNVSIPLNLTKGRFFRFIQFKTGWDQIDVIKTSQTADTQYSGNISAFSAGFQAFNLIKLSDRDIASRWGQMLSVSYKKSVLNDYAGDLLSVRAYLLFPGLMRHHSLKLSYGYQQINANKYHFDPVTEYPRGIKKYNDKTLNRYSVDYKFPFCYPDFGIGPVIYFKRLKANFFFDYASATSQAGQAVYYKTTGVELTSDLHIARSFIPFNAGVRYINKLSENNKSAFEFIFAFNFDSF